jgi:hypothetical protein
MWKHLSDKIKAMVVANGQVQEVYDYEVAQFGGDPAATLTPSADRADYRTTSANRRVYAFSLMLWVKRGEPRDDKEAEDVLKDLVDSITRTFDKYYTLGSGSPGSALVLEAGYTMIRTEAVPGEWFYSNREALYRGAEITIRCHVDVDVNLIASS